MSCTIGHLAELVGGTIYHADPTTLIDSGIEYDSRAVTPGCAFIALPGKKVHGREYAQSAIDSGAQVIITTEPMDLPSIVVDPRIIEQCHTIPNMSSQSMTLQEESSHNETVALLHAYGIIAQSHHHYCTSQGLITIAVTGSVGKTTTKDALAALFTQLYGEQAVLYAPGSMNNEIGVPWLVTHIQPHHKYLIVEMGARHRGDIAYLCSIAPPTIAIELGVGTAHMGEFGSIEAIAEAKGELIAHLPTTATAILNADDPRVLSMPTQARTITCGVNHKADYTYQYHGLTENGTVRTSVTCNNVTIELTLPTHGEHLVRNFLMAMVASIVCGTEYEEAADAVENIDYQPKHRMQLQELADGTVFIDDAYNANPESMRGAIKYLMELAHLRKKKHPQLNTWAVLGQMGELGEDSVLAHDAVARYAVRFNISGLICVGNTREIKAMYQGAVMEGIWDNMVSIVDDTEQASILLRNRIEPGDIILVKASNASALWKVLDQFKGEQNT